MHERLRPTKPEARILTEQEFHQDRWERVARQDELRGAIRRYLDRNSPDRTPEDVREEEEIRRKADIERRGSQEYGKWHSRLVPMLEHVKATPEGSEDRDTLLLVMGGAMGGSYSAAQVLAFEQAGIKASRFKSVVGVSSGSGPASFYVAGQAKEAVSFFMQECTTKEFLDFKRVGKILNTEYIAKAMREGPKALDTQAIEDSPTDLYVIAKNKRTGKSDLINMKTAKPDMVAATEASSAIPAFRESVRVDGEDYIDGGFNSVPLEEIVTKFKPKKILVLPNESFNYNNTRTYSGVDRALMWGAGRMGSVGSMATAEAFFKSRGNFREFLDKAEKMYGVEIAFMWPPDKGVGPLTNDADLLTAAMLDTARATFGELGLEQPEEIELRDSLVRSNDKAPEPRHSLAA